MGVIFWPQKFSEEKRKKSAKGAIFFVAAIFFYFIAETSEQDLPVHPNYASFNSRLQSYATWSVRHVNIGPLIKPFCTSGKSRSIQPDIMFKL